MADSIGGFRDLPASLQQRLRDLGLPDQDISRPCSLADISYLLTRCPYLCLLGPKMSDPPEPTVIYSRAHWRIQDKGDELAVSGSHLMFSSQYRGGQAKTGKGDDDGGEGDVINQPGHGTIIAQAFRTAFEMVDIAHDRGWGGVSIAQGNPLMKRAAYIRATELYMDVLNYTPDEKDQFVIDWFAQTVTLTGEKKTPKS